MDLTDIQISEIKNLDLIYVYTIDSIFLNTENKYVGARVVYDKNKTIALDYKNEHFPKLIKRIIERYNKEKNERKIILLGDLTKKLVNDSSFEVLEKNIEKELQTQRIHYFNTHDYELQLGMPYLIDVFYGFLKVYNNQSEIIITNILGYNKNYTINYKVNGEDRQLAVIMYLENNTLNFKFNLQRIKRVFPLKGTLTNNGGYINIICKSNDESVLASFIYDALNESIERKIILDGQTHYYDESIVELSAKDKLLINFYFKLCDLQVAKNIIKINDTTYLLSEEIILNNSEDAYLFSNLGEQINIQNDEVRIKCNLKNYLSKYNNQVTSILDEKTVEITFKKLKIDSHNYIIIENKTYLDGNEEYFTYKIIETENDVDFTKPFEFKNSFYIEKSIESIDDAREYILKRERT